MSAPRDKRAIAVFVLAVNTEATKKETAGSGCP